MFIGVWNFSADDNFSSEPTGKNINSQWINLFCKKFNIFEK